MIDSRIAFSSIGRRCSPFAFHGLLRQSSAIGEPENAASGSAS
ncbi:unnamed protein product [Staurois parvus]|uniref:Uncharacterized protein n=1 Tax=Staurois parvus TaxID=386267 RepID=A0ABN9EEU1_9NEOB|nr:unnamed protein product [Staurois parvus]